MDYRASIGYLNSFIDFERIPEPRLKTQPDDIERFRALLGDLGNPHLRYKTIHVVGTKGKGSTSALLASILKEASYKVGLYTSPHLLSVRERIAINGRMISKREFTRLIGSIREHFSRHFTSDSAAFRTVFEHLTATASSLLPTPEWTSQLSKPEWEPVGFDYCRRTDTHDNYSIGLDHTAVLGNTIALSQQTRLTPSSRRGAVSAPQTDDARKELQARANAVGAKLYYAPGADEFDVAETTLHGSFIRHVRGDVSNTPMRLALAGRFQLDNLSNVLTSIDYLRTADIP